MDKVPIVFNVPPSQTVDKVGANFVPITTTGHERNRGISLLCQWAKIATSANVQTENFTKRRFSERNCHPSES